jgi:hypothetical protein
MHERLKNIKNIHPPVDHTTPLPILKTPGILGGHRTGRSTEHMPVLTPQATPPDMTLPTNPFAYTSQPTPSEVFRATPFVLPPPTITARKDGKMYKAKKRGCKDQLLECQSRLRNCLKIMHWQSVNGKSFSTGLQQPRNHLAFSPNVVSTPLPVAVQRKKLRQQKVNKRLSSELLMQRPKRETRKAPTRYTPSAYE